MRKKTPTNLMHAVAFAAALLVGSSAAQAFEDVSKAPTWTLDSPGPEPRVVGSVAEVSEAPPDSGNVADFQGGYLEFPGSRPLLPETFTLAVRFRSDAEHPTGTLISQKAGRNALSFDLALFEASFLNLPILAFSQDDPAQPGKGAIRTANLHLNGIDLRQWNTVVVRCDGKHMELFWNGKLRHRRAVGSHLTRLRTYVPLHGNAPLGLAIGADPYGNKRFEGQVGPVAAWNEALGDADLAALFGRELDTTWEGRIDTYTEVGADGVRTDNRDIMAGMFPAAMSERERFAAVEDRMEGLIQKFMADNPWYPKYHITVPGFTYNTHALWQKGRWHLFPMWMGDYCHSGWFEESRYTVAHFSSEDLIHWRIHPFPFKNREMEGKWVCNLSFVSEGERVHAFNLSVDATPDVYSFHSDDPVLDEWTYNDPQPRFHKDTEFHRRMDPAAFKHDGQWYLTGARQRRGVPAANDWRNGFPLYRSDDRVNWHYAGVLFSHPWGECAQMIQLKEEVYLLTMGGSMGMEPPERQHQYLLGTFTGEKFVPKAGGQWDHGSEPRIIAHTAVNDAGRIINWFTVPLHDEKDARTSFEFGWKGMQTLPRVATFREDGSLAFHPARELEGLREAETGLPSGTVLANGESTVPDILGGQQEVIVTFDKAQLAEKSGISFFRGPEEYRVYYDRETRQVVVDLKRGNDDPQNEITTGKEYRTPPLSFDGEVQFHVFLDASLLEVFADGHTMNVSIWPKDPSQLQLKAFSEGSDSRIKSLQAWKLRPIEVSVSP